MDPDLVRYSSESDAVRELGGVDRDQLRIHRCFAGAVLRHLQALSAESRPQAKADLDDATKTQWNFR